jgi:hypothetical protein
MVCSARCEMLDAHRPDADDPRLGPEGGEVLPHAFLAEVQMRRPRPSAMSLTLWSEYEQVRRAQPGARHAL